MDHSGELSSGRREEGCAFLGREQGVQGIFRAGPGHPDETYDGHLIKLPNGLSLSGMM